MRASTPSASGPGLRSRREFLADSALTLSWGAVAALAGLPANAVPRARAAAPNDRVTLGIVGVGGMGLGLLNIFQRFPDVEIAAVCDVHEPHLLRAREAAGGESVQAVKDFRRVLDRDDVDAVVVATPDHWHAIPSILACQAGKDVYCEKPLGARVVESRAMADAARKHARVTQMGNLIHAGENYHRMVEIVQSGVLGQITKCRVWMASNRNAPEGLGQPPDSAPPAGCDYDFWLGPAPERPFNPNRFTFNWRFFWDYAGGMLCDFVCHLVDPVLWAMRASKPSTIVATGGRYALRDNAETPDNLEVVYHFDDPAGPDAGPGFDLVWSHSDSSTRGFENRGAGILFQGLNGTLVGHYNDHVIHWEKGREAELPEKTLPRSVGHHREWLDAIKSRAQTSCNFEYGHQLTTVGNLGNVALHAKSLIQWDGDAERVVNIPEANQFLARPEYRKPWELPKV